MVRTEDIRFQYNSGKQTFSFPNLNIKAEEDLLILGQSGIGKTTLLHLLAGLLKPVDGNISIDNTVITSLSASKLDAFRGESIGIVFQKKHAIQSLTIFENLLARLYFSKKNIGKAAIDALLKELGLYEHKNKKPKELSEGQLQRLGIAMAVIHQPKVILADEPTSSLDDENCSIVIDLLKRQAEKNKANLIVITHDQRVKPFFQNSITL
ncbi:MAG: ATP-binding cassette domain-containing protein [Psychroserpens sp.]|nr:ATP-binding cassette domain-containing protein [Psychroserpens sp.]